MTGNKLITVVIPVFNGSRFLCACLKSVFSQDYRPMEVIVVDGGSTDETSDIARSFSEVRCIVQKDQGPASARNVGVGLAHGEFIAFMDADDLWRSDKLAKQVGYLGVNSEVMCCISRMHAFLEPGLEWPASLNRDHYAQDPLAYVPSALVARSELFKLVGCFDTDLKTGEDSDWFFRVKDASIQIGVVDDVLLFKRIHKASLTYHSEIVIQNMLRVVRRSVARKQAPISAQDQANHSERT
ncbi:MAG: glycosyltransferase [Ktedonobacteraceae bacterium]